MNEDAAKDWSKDRANQLKVINTRIGIDNPAKSKLAIFMAGVPGAGKTEFVRGLREESSMRNSVIIEHDQLVEYIDNYTPEKYYNFRKAGSNLVTALLNHCLKSNFPFILDGTLSSDTAKRNIKKTLNRGYSVIIIYIHQDIKSAWNLTKDRELVKKRSIEREGFLRTVHRINKTLRDIFNSHRDNERFAMWIIKKNGKPGAENSEVLLYEGSSAGEGSSVIEEILEQSYNIEEIN